MKTFSPKPGDIQRKWWVVDAAKLPIGRVSTKVATLLQGKHKPTYTPHEDMGDFVVIINADKVPATGYKESDKVYYRHTGYPGGIKSETLKEMREKHPERILETAIKGMLPKGPLGRKMLSKLKVYAGSDHPHAAQQPEPLEIEA
ncbi:MAG: 50S ribosomal protein L13 [Legionellales bacterium]|nr:50S ribosomal protein L13 [Legionellales bacterium]